MEMLWKYALVSGNIIFPVASFFLVYLTRYGNLPTCRNGPLKRKRVEYPNSGQAPPFSAVLNFEPGQPAAILRTPTICNYA